MVKTLNNFQLLYTLTKAAYAQDEKTVNELWYEALRRLDSAYYDDSTVICEASMQSITRG